MPLTVRVWVLTGWPSRVSASSGPVPPAARDHRLQAAGAGAGREAEGHLAAGAVEGDALEGRAVAAVDPGQQLARRDDGHPACLRRGDERVRVLVVRDVGVHVGGEDAVEALRTQRAVEQRGRLGGDRLVGLVGELRRRLIGVDERPVRGGVAHREARPGEEARPIVQPGAGPVVVGGVEADPVRRLRAGLAGPVAPHDAVGAARARRGGRRVELPELLELQVEVAVEALGGGEVEAVLVAGVRRAVRRARDPQVQRDLEALGLVGGHLRAADRRAGEDVGGRSDALPVGHRAARGALREVAIELALRPVLGVRLAAAAVVVAGEHDRGLPAIGQVPEARQRDPIGRHLGDEVGQEALLLIGARGRHAVEIDPVGLHVAGLGPEEEVVGADRPRWGRTARRAPGRPTPGCPGACRRSSAPDRR